MSARLALTAIGGGIPAAARIKAAIRTQPAVSDTIKTQASATATIEALLMT